MYAIEQFFLEIRQLRDDFLKPFTIFLSAFHISPNVVSFISLSLAFSFVLSVSEFPFVAFLFIFGSLFADTLDGAMARYQGKDFDAQILVDAVVGTITFTLYVSGLVFAGYLAWIIALIFVPLLFTATIIRMRYRLFELTPRRLQLKDGGAYLAIPGALKGVVYLYFPVMLISGVNAFGFIIYTASTVLAIHILADIVIRYIDRRKRYESRD